MYLYYFMLGRYRHHYQQMKCILVFLCLLLPFFLVSLLIRSYSLWLYQITLFLGGWVTWTFAEYILHRFWMHRRHSDSAMAKTHHHHHSHPTEIVVSDLQRAIMFCLFLAICSLALYLKNYFTYAAGLYSGMAGYFFMHKLLHMKIAQRVFKRLFRYHIYHHCKYHNTCFGISVPWWDDLFGTVPRNPVISQRVIDFYFNESHKDE
jgi:hypothetical protein